jgi:hypothetical protein
VALPLRRNSITLIVSTGGNPAQWAAAVREAIQRLDNRAAIKMRTLEEMVDRAAFSRRTLALLMGVLEAVALRNHYRIAVEGQKYSERAN